MSMVSDGLRFVVGTLTVVPVLAPAKVDQRVARVGVLAAPVVGVLLSAGAAGVAAAGQVLGLASGVTAVLVVGVLTLVTRGLHLDGLADTADGLAASYRRERALEVMRRGDVGPAGTMTLVVVVLAQVFALAACLEAGRGLLAVGVAVLASRAVLPLVCVRGLPAARAEGLGAAVASTVPPLAAGAVAAVVLLVSAGTGWTLNDDALRAVLAVALGWAIAAVVVARCVRRFGGVTGDVIGATVEVAMAGCLLVFSVGG